MKRFTALLLIVGLAVLMTASSVFAMTDSFRDQATAGMFGGNDDDAADNIDDPVDTIRKFPKWVLLTRFSNILNDAGDGSSDRIFEYGSGDNDSSPSRTFYGLMGSSEWFETNLGMPINFAVSFERRGGRTPLLDTTSGGLAFDTTAVTSADGDAYDDGEGGALEYTARQAYQSTAMTETNFTVGYKVSDQLQAGLNWKHNSDSTTFVNSGEMDDGTNTFTYSNGLVGDTLTLDANDEFTLAARYAVNDDVHVRGDVTLGYHRGRENTQDAYSPLSSVVGSGLPGGIETDNGTDSFLNELKIVDTRNALIFGLAGKVYYFPLNKGQINSKLSYRYQGGAVSHVETRTNEATDVEDEYSLKGTNSKHTLTWDTRKHIELDKINVRLGLVMKRDSDTTSGKGEVQNNGDAFDVAEQDGETVTIKNITWTWGFPIGAELTLKEKWTLRVGCAHNVELSTDSYITEGINTVTKGADRSTNYTYGVGYDWSENLKLDINAFLEETASGSENQSILDLATYRNLAISAALIF